MGLGLIVINIFFAVLVLAAIPGLLIWAIRTAHRDHGTATATVVVSAPEPVLVVEELEDQVVPAVVLA